jgi:two-component system sensor histidine kinase TctE
MRWQAVLSRAGSLRRFLLLWLVGGLWTLVALLTLWQGLLMLHRLGQAQDARLVAAARQLAARADAASAPLPGVRYARVGAMRGEWIAGHDALRPFPWAGTLAADGAPQLYVAHVEGELVRGAAALGRWQRDGAPVVVQAAAPWRERLPGWDDWRQGPLPWLWGLALALSALAWSGVALALRWLDGARAALDAQGPEAAAYHGPSELEAAVQRMQALHRKQRDWVDEQRRFLADASHQLRTPMAVLRTQLQSALAGEVAAAEVLPQMLHTVDRAAGLANQLLSVSKLEQIKRAGQLQPVDLQAAAREAVMELSPLVAAKRLDFELTGPALQVPGDAVMLGELLRNLLANAIHHAPPGARLGVVLREAAGRRELLVWDEGPGLDDALRPRLFQPFASGKGGVGLGLSICRQIAEAMGATLGLYDRIDAGRVIGVDAVVAWEQGP